MPTLVKPMLATLGKPPHGAGWGWEWKWDGARTVAYLDGRGGLRLRSRNDLDVTGSYPELAPLARVEQPMVLDGEIVALDASGAPSFGRLQRRMHVRAPTAALLRTVPVRFYVFDLLWHAGEDLTGQPYAARRSRLEQFRLPDTTGATAAVPDAFLGDVDPADLLQVASDNALEGVVAKRLTSRYRPGQRSRDWVKVPLVHTQEFVIVGWTPGSGRREGMIGSLLLGAHNQHGDLVYAGQVGTGLTDAMLHDLHARLAPLARPDQPLAEPVPREHTRHAQWVEPALVGEVAYRSTGPGGRLRHPSWRGLRPDRRPYEVEVARTDRQ